MADADGSVSGVLLLVLSFPFNSPMPALVQFHQLYVNRYTIGLRLMPSHPSPFQLPAVRVPPHVIPDLILNSLDNSNYFCFALTLTPMEIPQ